ncbi:MAG: hypothetical protein AAFN13_04265 [Bacteroidota bacterium]
MLRLAALTVALFALTLNVGCADSLVTPETLVPGDLIPGGLPPAVGNTTDSFGFAVTADDFAFEQDYALTFTGDASQVGLSVVGYSSGTASLELLDEDGTVLYARNLAQNVAEGAQTVAGRPASAVLRFEGYSGIVSVGVSGAE